MDVLLISFSICLLGVFVTVLLFSLAMRPTEEETDTDTEKTPSAPSAGFFMDENPDPPTRPQGPTNPILVQLEHHVRSEQEAAETFLEGPNPDSLHAPSNSPLWN